MALTTKKSDFFQYCLLGMIMVLFFLPVIWVVLASLDKNASLSIRRQSFSFFNYQAVISDGFSLKSLGVSLILSLGQSFVTILVGLLTAYPLSRLHMRFKRQLLLGILFLTGLPVIALMVPVYQLFSVLKIQNSLIATIFFMATAALPFNIWLLRNFMNSVSLTLDEAARIDGANALQIIFQIILPLMASGIATVFIYTFTASWGNFFVPYILLNSPDKLPAAVRIYEFFNQYGLVTYGKLAAFSILYTIPSIILYIHSQRYLTGGLALVGTDK